MSKFDIGVGDEFPLQDGGNGPQDHRGGHRARHGHHRHHMHHGHHHHRAYVMSRPAALLLIAGLAALIAEHKVPVEAAYGMIGLGIAGVATMAVLHWRHHHRQQVS